MFKTLVLAAVMALSLGFAAGCDKGESGDSLTYESFDPASYDGQDACTGVANDIESPRGSCKAACDCIHQHPLGSYASDSVMNDGAHGVCLTGCEQQEE